MAMNILLSRDGMGAVDILSSSSEVVDDPRLTLWVVAAVGGDVRDVGDARRVRSLGL